MQLCECYLNLGDFEQAAELLLRLRKLRPDVISVPYMMMQLPEVMLGSGIDLNSAISKTRKAKGETQSEFDNKKAYVVAAVLDRQEKYEEAWKVLLAAKAKSQNDAEVLWAAEAQQNRKALEVASALNGSQLPRYRDRKTTDGLAPLFILGPSRSGKTTLEKLIGSHDDVSRGYESEVVKFAVQRASQMAGLTNISDLLQLPKNLYASFANEFRQRLAEAADNHKLVTVTTPGLISSVGLLAQNLPEVRFVFVKRNRDDTALRIFMKSYRSGNNYSQNLNNTYSYIDWYDRMIGVWSEKLRQRAIIVEYETMVAEPSSLHNSITALCGLPSGSLELPDIGSDIGASDAYKDLMRKACSAQHTAIF